MIIKNPPGAKLIVRSDKPSKYDHAPQGSICRVQKALSSDYDLYKQISSHSDEPIWEFIETMKKNSVIPPLL